MYLFFPDIYLFYILISSADSEELKRDLETVEIINNMFPHIFSFEDEQIRSDDMLSNAQDVNNIAENLEPQSSDDNAIKNQKEEYFCPDYILNEILK